MPHANRPGKRTFPNPFYVVLMLASLAFVATALAYLVAPVSGPGADAARRAPAAAVWFDRNAPALFGIEFAVMMASAALAVATDRWFPAKSARAPRPNG